MVLGEPRGSVVSTVSSNLIVKMPNYNATPPPSWLKIKGYQKFVRKIRNLILNAF